MLKIETIKLGYLQTNCYLIKKDNQCLVVDPGDEFEKIKEAIGECKPLAILLTHHHFDHIGALKQVRDIYSIPVYDCENVKDNEEVTIGPFQFQVLYTKGHDDTCITFYFKKENIMFVGDFVFKESIGRTDLETGSDEKMNMSLERLKQFEEDILLYPGHGDSTTLDYEKKHNIFF